MATDLDHPESKHVGRLDALVVDRRTGEVQAVAGSVEVNLNTKGGKRRPRRQRRHLVWGMLDIERAMEADLNGSEYRVMFAIAANMHHDTEIARVRPAEIVRDTGLSRFTVYRALDSLLERNVILRAEDGYRVSKWLFYRGAVEDWEQETDDDPKIVTRPGRGSLLPDSIMESLR